MISTSPRPRAADQIAAILIAVLSFCFAPVVAGSDTARASGPLGPPPGTYRILSGDGSIRIPFEIFRSEIRMNAEINRKPVRMVIDNGYLWDQLLMFGSPRVDSLGLRYDGQAEVGGSGDGDSAPSQVAAGVTITFPGIIEFYDQTTIVTPYKAGALNLWEGIEGQVSAQFFKHFVVDIDFDKLVVTLIEPDRFRYTGNGTEVPLVHLEHNAWGSPCRFVMADGTAIEHLAMWDIGLNDALQFETNGPARLPLPEDAVEASLGFGMQGETVGHVGHIRSFEIGGYKLENVRGNFSTAAENDGTDYDDVMIGFALLEQFHAVFDYPHARVFLSPNKRFGITTKDDTLE
jgi:hypothetical protein